LEERRAAAVTAREVGGVVGYGGGGASEAAPGGCFFPSFSWQRQGQHVRSVNLCPVGKIRAVEPGTGSFTWIRRELFLS
jgi:hypothetical protein